MAKKRPCTRIKICGITNMKDAAFCALAGADALGFVLSRSPRRVPIEHLAAICAGLGPFINRVGVFVNEDMGFIERFLDKRLIDIVQLHGDETPEFCSQLRKKAKVIKALRIKSKESIKEIARYRVDAFLLDTYSEGYFGGTGRAFDWDIAKKIVCLSDVPVILSGGLNAGNVSKAIKKVRPYGVDASSGLEKAIGMKDLKSVEKFIKRIKKI